ncbi:MAG: hypothetical protein QF733_05895 [Phycisphaerales bacterium]|nr:hypothetical protein [Phycisphaerales bacterium]
MALFGRKNQNDQETGDDAGVFVPHPEKATKWFKHASDMVERTSYETALVYYASGLRFDPANEAALAAMLEAGKRHVLDGGKRIASKQTKTVEGPSPVEKMAVALLYWMTDLQNPAMAIKALESTVKADHAVTGRFFAPHVLGIVSRGKKPTKQQYVDVKDHCKALEAWDHALMAGQAAMALDPTDGPLEHEIKDLSAQRAMSKGGYEEAAGKEGGFREFVKDMDKQRELEQEESIAGAGGGAEQVLARAKQRFEASPDVADNVNRYATLLRREGTDSALKEAEAVYMRGFKKTNEYRFRMAAGDIRMQRTRDRIKALEEAEDSADAAANEQRIATLQTQLLDFEAKEFEERAAKYPTDRTIRFHLGEVMLRRGDTEAAMGCFQKAKDEPRLRAAAGHLLGRCFAMEGWHAEAAAEYRDVLSKIDATEAARELEIRYDLMVSLIEMAKTEDCQSHARDALEICSGIARQDITYRDIRDRRREIDELVKRLA